MLKIGLRVLTTFSIIIFLVITLIHFFYRVKPWILDTYVIIVSFFFIHRNPYFSLCHLLYTIWWKCSKSLLHFEHKRFCQNLQHILLSLFSTLPCNSSSSLYKHSFMLICICREFLNFVNHFKHVLIAKQNFHLIVSSVLILTIKNWKCIWNVTSIHLYLVDNGRKKIQNLYVLHN